MKSAKAHTSIDRAFVGRNCAERSPTLGTVVKSEQQRLRSRLTGSDREDYQAENSRQLMIHVGFGIGCDADLKVGEMIAIDGATSSESRGVRKMFVVLG